MRLNEPKKTPTKQNKHNDPQLKLTKVSWIKF